MDEQLFFNLRIHFNLRQTRINKPTLIYVVFSYNKRQYKYSIGLKVYPNQWNREKEIAAISNGLTRLDNRNNRIINKKIVDILTKIEEKKEYICEHFDNIDIVSEIKNIVNPKIRIMKSKKIIATSVLRQMMGKYIKEKSQGIYKSAINSLKKYLDKEKIDDDLYMLNTDVLKGFIDSLDLQFKSVHNYEGAIITLINHANEDSNLKANINLTGYKRIEDKRSREQKKSKQIPLTEKQLKDIYNLRGLANNEEEARDLFLLQCLLGQRISDVPKLLKGEYITTKIDEINEEVISFNVEKTNEEATIYLFPIAREILEKYKGGLNFYNILSENRDAVKYAESRLNKEIKNICKKANLISDVNYTEQYGRNEIISKRKKLYELMHTHIARHTFITLMCKLGMSKNDVIIATAHTDTKMIDDVYNHTTVEDKGKKLLNAIKGIKGSCFFTISEEDNISNSSKQEDNLKLPPDMYDKIKNDAIELQKSKEEIKEKKRIIKRKNKKINSLSQVIEINNQISEIEINKKDSRIKLLELGVSVDEIEEINEEEDKINEIINNNIVEETRKDFYE